MLIDVGTPESINLFYKIAHAAYDRQSQPFMWESQQCLDNGDVQTQFQLPTGWVVTNTRNADGRVQNFQYTTYVQGKETTIETELTSPVVWKPGMPGVHAVHRLWRDGNLLISAGGDGTMLMDFEVAGQRLPHESLATNMAVVAFEESMKEVFGLKERPSYHPLVIPLAVNYPVRCAFACVM
ncbi:MAG: hypothetical protein COV45_08475 [Deltaproteobacteria bacterium CG11_big_fil_rev_8_21_14_0_20_47_16]|nr:MAG: hypothetical protein COV45_08475 [Deltaproteobacteria bacterium CG11_big_fil_rev_8_21_14_0_20_47_16]